MSENDYIRLCERIFAARDQLPTRAMARAIMAAIEAAPFLLDIYSSWQSLVN